MIKKNELTERQTLFVKALVKLLIEAEEQRDKSTGKLEELEKLIRENHDTKYLYLFTKRLNL